MSFRFAIDHPVRWGDVDWFGVVNNAVYFTLFEQARFEYFQRLGLLEEGDFPFVLGETTARFLRPARAGMVLAIAVRTTRLGHKSLGTEYEVRHGGEVLATGRATLVYVDDQLRSRPIPAAARARLLAFEGLAADA